jgi:hypothetical protein
MAKRYTHSTTIDVERAVGLVRRDAPAALVHGRRNAIEPDERMKCIDQHGLVPDISRCVIAEDFNNNNRAQQIGQRHGANEIVKTFYLSAGLLLGSVAVRTAQRVTAAGQTIRIQRRLGSRKRRWLRVDGRRSQRHAGYHAIVMQNLGCLVHSFSGSARLLRRMGPSDGRLPLGRED